MTDFAAQYAAKLVTAEVAVKSINSGAKVAMGLEFRNRRHF